MYKLTFEILEDEHYDYQKEEVISETVEEGLDKLYDEVWASWHMGCSVEKNFNNLNEPEIGIDDGDCIANTKITIKEVL